MARLEIYVQLVASFGEDPKVRALAQFGKDSRGIRDLYVQMICYCKRNLSDGVVPVHELGVLVYPESLTIGKRDAERLVQVGLIEAVDGGYVLPAFLRRNKSKAQVEEGVAATAVKAAEAGVRGNHRRHHVAKGITNPTCTLCQPDRVGLGSTRSGGDRVGIAKPRSETETETEKEQDQKPAGWSAVAKPADQTITQRSKRIVDAYAALEPMCKWPAVNGVVIKAIKAEKWADTEIQDALLRLAKEGRSVTVDTMRVELDGLTPQRRSNGQSDDTRQMLERAMQRAQAKEAATE